MADILWNMFGFVVICIAIALTIAIIYISITDRDDKNDADERKD